MASTEQWQAGQKIGTSYVIEECVEKGGMGVVYRARHKDLDRPVAIKAIRDIHASKPDIAARFQSEGKILAKIHHPHVVQVYDSFEHDGAHYLAMEWLEGRSLGRRLTTGVALDVSECVRLLIQVCAGVEVAHQAGVIHRDLKPDNIFLVRGMEGEESAKVLDFGIARGNVSYTATGQHLGTPHYMSPEQWRDSKELGAASDQFSFGVVAYHCATGRLPFDSESRNINVLAAKVQAGVYTPLRELRHELPAGLCAVIERLLQVDPARRYGSMREAGAALLAFADADTRGRYAWEFRPRTRESEPRGSIDPVQGDETQGAAELKVDVAAIPPTMPMEGIAVPVLPEQKRELKRGLKVSAVAFVLGALVAIVWMYGRWRERDQYTVARAAVRTEVPEELRRAPVSESAQPPTGPTVQPSSVEAPAQVGPARHPEQRNRRVQRTPTAAARTNGSSAQTPAGSDPRFSAGGFR